MYNALGSVETRRLRRSNCFAYNPAAQQSRGGQSHLFEHHYAPFELLQLSVARSSVIPIVIPLSCKESLYA